MKKEIEAIRLKTVMSECFKIMQLPYPKQVEAAREKIKILQEEHKSLTGKYAEEFILEAVQKWEINSVTRHDGIVFSIGDKYSTLAGTYTIKRLIFKEGRVTAEAVEGGFSDLEKADKL